MQNLRPSNINAIFQRPSCGSPIAVASGFIAGTAAVVVCAGYNVVDRPRPRAADDDLSVNHAGVLVMSAADVSLLPTAVTQPTTFEGLR